MKLKKDKQTILFGSALAGILVCFVMTVVTAIREKEEKAKPQPITMPTPAMAQ